MRVLAFLGGLPLLSIVTSIGQWLPQQMSGRYYRIGHKPINSLSIYVRVWRSIHKERQQAPSTSSNPRRNEKGLQQKCCRPF
ncbi:protein of unknown function [Alcaligenes faecalis subsp. faecalis]|nr:protein of unknown function [Alcaligenes faecalis subsp. faecalis]